MVIDGDIAPLLAAVAGFVLRPLHLDLAALPREDQDDAGHFEAKRVVALHLHAQDLCLAGDETHLDLLCGGVVVLFDHVGVQGGDGELHGFYLLLSLHITLL